MTKEQLLASAQKLHQIDEAHATEFSNKRESLLELMNARMNARADITDLVGENNLEMMKDNHANHLRFMESVFFELNPEVLTDTVLWVFRAYRSRNFKSTYWSAQLNTFLEIHKEKLSPECFNAISPYYNWMQINIPVFNDLAQNDLDAPLSSH